MKDIEVIRLLGGPLKLGDTCPRCNKEFILLGQDMPSLSYDFGCDCIKILGSKNKEEALGFYHTHWVNKITWKEVPVGVTARIRFPGRSSPEPYKYEKRSDILGDLDHDPDRYPVYRITEYGNRSCGYSVEPDWIAFDLEFPKGFAALEKGEAVPSKSHLDDKNALSCNVCYAYAATDTIPCKCGSISFSRG